MAAVEKASAYPHIEKTPGVRNGRACITGTRIAVKDIVVLLQQAFPVEEMLTYYSSRPLTPAEIHAALTYYYDNRSEIDAELAADDEWEKGHEARKTDILARRATK